MANQQADQVVIIACGSFNPITNMHLRMFELARDHLHDTGKYQVVKGIISPVGDGYKKKGLIEACHRVEMARLASDSSDWIKVDSWESSQPEWVETAKVVRHHYEELEAAAQEDEDEEEEEVYSFKRRRMEEDCYCNSNQKASTRLFLLCGTDVLESFSVPNLWKQDDIVELVGRHGVVCITRGDSDAEKFIHQSDTLWSHRHNIHLVREWVTNDISATHARRALRRGRSVRYLLPDAVVSYIKKHRLYSGESEKRNADVVLAPLARYAEAGPS